MKAAAGDLFVGAISGTSMDGIDLAVLADDAPPTIRAGHTAVFAPELKATLTALALGQTDDIDLLGRAHAELGTAIGTAILDFIRDLGLTPTQIRAVGSHGQTIRHRPHGERAFSLQIGDANRIAEVTGIDTVTDFRGRDIAAGGQGAPLVPAFHQALFGTPSVDRAILNIGGIANLTVLPADPKTPVSGFDTGPGNALLDAWIGRARGEAFDQDGRWSATGTTNGALLAALEADPYFEALPPKSTGREHFNLEWLSDRVRSLAPQDVQATLAQLTANTIAGALRRWAPTVEEIVVCGGGRLNGDLMGRLSDALVAHNVRACEAYGFAGDWIEAAAFAWLAARHLARQPGNVVTATGAAGPRVLGALYPGR